MMHQYIKPILASLLFYLIPLLSGIGINTLLRKKKGLLNGTFLLESFVLGAISLYIQIILLDLVKIYSSFDTDKLFSFLTGTNILVNAFIYFLRTFQREIPDISKEGERVQNTLLMALLILITIATYSIWRLGSPPNTTLNWDIYHHQTLINLINQGKFKIVTSSLSDSFQFAGYSTIFHTMASIPQTLLSPNILEFWFFMEYLHLLTGALVAFYFAYSINKNKYIALLSAILATLIFESSMAYTNLFLIPQNLAGIISAAFIAKIIIEYPQNRRDLIVYFVVFSLFIIPLHSIVGSFGIFLALVTIVFLYAKPIRDSIRVQNLLFLSSLMCIPIVYFISKSIDFSQINRGEAAHYILGIKEKFSTMRDIYGYGLISFLPLGYIYALKLKESKYKLLLILVNGILAILIGILPYNLKFLAVGRFPLITLMSLGVWSLVKNLPMFFKILAMILTTITFGIIFIINSYMYKGVPNYKNLSTHISPPEIQAAEFLKKTYGKERDKVLLISEPATMHILEGLSGINSPGGAYTSLRTRQLLTETYLKRDKNIRRKLFEIKDLVEKNKHEKIIFVVSGRYREWQLGPEEDRYGIHWNVWRPKDLDPAELQKHDFIYYLRDVLGFRQVFINEGLVIFEVERGFL